MKFQVLLPWILDERMAEYMGHILPADVDVAGLTQGTVAESKYDTAQTLPEFLEAIVAAEKNGYSALINACLSDSGVEEGRELVEIPVIGVTQAGLHVSALLGDKFTTFVPNEYIRRWTQKNVRKYGFEGRASVRTLRTPVTASDAVDACLKYKKSGELPGSIIDDLVSQCIAAIQKDSAEVLSIGCGALIWMVDIIREELSKKGYDIPVLQPYAVAVEVARALVNLRVSHGYIVR